MRSRESLGSVGRGSLKRAVPPACAPSASARSDPLPLITWPMKSSRGGWRASNVASPRSSASETSPCSKFIER